MIYFYLIKMNCHSKTNCTVYQCLGGESPTLLKNRLSSLCSNRYQKSPPLVLRPGPLRHFAPY